MTIFLLIAIGVVSVFLLTIDVVKIFLETCWPKRQRQLDSDPSKFTVIITAYNEAVIIVKTIRFFTKIFPKKNILLANDGSTDRTAEIAKAAEPEIHVISMPHKGKAKATLTALRYVTTPYVILADADIYPSENLCCPTSLLEDFTSCAVKILPKINSDKHLTLRKILTELQNHEYEKAMNSKEFGSNWGSVYLVSGAFGFFRTKRIEKLITKQSDAFSGEDLERTLIDLAEGGRTNYIPELIETDVPDTILKLIKQRVLSWWPGLWKCFPLFLRILFQKNSSIALRFEILYQLVSTMTEPLKLATLFLIIWYQDWRLLLGLYFLYFFIELFIAIRLDEIGKIKHFVLIIGLYPIYGIFQMILRIIGLGILIQRRINQRWPRIKPALSLSLLMAILPTLAHGAKIIATPGIEYISDSNGQTFIAPTLGVQYKNTWLDSQYGPYNNRLDFGMSHRWLGIGWTPQIRIRTRESFELNPKLVVEVPLVKPLIGRINWGYQLLGDLQGTTMSGGGIDFYYGDANFISFDVTKEIGNYKKSTLFIMKNRLTWKDIALSFGSSINTFGDAGFFGWIGWKYLRIGYSWNENLEHYNLNRASYHLSLSIPLN